MVTTKPKPWTEQFVARMMDAAAIGDRIRMDQVFIDVALEAINRFDAWKRRYTSDLTSIDELMGAQGLRDDDGILEDPPQPPPVHTVKDEVGTMRDTTATAEPTMQLRFKDMPDPDDPTKWRKTLQQLHKVTPRTGAVYFEWRDVRVEV